MQLVVASLLCGSATAAQWLALAHLSDLRFGLSGCGDSPAHFIFPGGGGKVIRHAPVFVGSKACSFVMTYVILNTSPGVVSGSVRCGACVTAVPLCLIHNCLLIYMI